MLTEEQKQIVIDVLTEKVVSLKGKNGTEFTQNRIAEIVRVLQQSIS